MRTFTRIMLATVAIAGTASADPASSDPSPMTRRPSAAPYLVLDVPAPPVPSLRLEAVRIAGERADGDWRYPEPGPMAGFEHGVWFVGYGHYRPRNARSAALHGGSMAATLVGEILIGTGSPLAGVAALVTGATLDSAGADVDRQAESSRH